MKYPMRYIEDEDFIQRLIEAGWDEEDAKKEVSKMYEEAAIEDGMGEK